MNIRIGELGENIACECLHKNGYRILGRNLREKWGEIDVLARAKDGTLVLVEVKTLAGEPLGLNPEDNLTRAKLVKVRRTGQLFANKHPELIKDTKGWRIDLITVQIKSSGAEPEIRHYENISF